MSRLSLFNSPLLLGFDQIERTLESISKAANEGYPPYNIERIGEDRLRITLAVAGFAAEDLDAQVDENRLTVRGRRPEEETSRVYLHRGIAARQFQRGFVLAEGVEVIGAALDTGLLHVDLQRRPVERPSRSIPIVNGGA